MPPVLSTLPGPALYAARASLRSPLYFSSNCWRNVAPVHGDLGPLCHLDGFFACHGACVVIAVAQQDDGAPDGASLWLLQQLVPTCIVESIVHCREAARSQRANADRKLLGVVGEVLRDLGSQVKADDKGLVVLPPDRLFQELHGRFLLELEATAYRFAGVDQQADLQGQIRLAAEVEDLFRRLAVVQNFEIVFLQVLDVVAVLVGDGENQVDFVYRLAHQIARASWRDSG